MLSCSRRQLQSSAQLARGLVCASSERALLRISTGGHCLTLAIAFALLPFFVAPLHAQSTATLQGRVFDESGAVLRGATISVRNRSANFDRSAPTDGEGRYQVASIPTGTYEVSAAATGFR